MKSLMCHQLARTPQQPANVTFRPRNSTPHFEVAPHRPLRVRVTASTAAAAPPESPAVPSPRAAPTVGPNSWAGYLPNCRGAAVATLAGKENGRQKICQDSFLTHAVQPSSPAAVIGVFDGHGRVGHVAARRVKDTMAAVLEHCVGQALEASAEPPSPSYAAHNRGSATAMSSGAAALELTPASAQSCLEATFSRAADAIRSAATDFLHSGSTACVVMLLHDSVVAAWAGDSRAVVGVPSAGEGGHSAVELTQDHKPNNLGEMARITAAGGRVARLHKDRNGNPIGPFRVFLPDGVSPGLAVARAFGDILLSSVGVVATPEFTVFPLRQPAAGSATAPGSPGHHVLIVASDGLWQFVESQAAVDIAAAAGTPEEAARLLVDAAERSWEAVYHGKHCDDITVAVAFL